MACNNEEVQQPASEMVEVTFNTNITTGSFSEDLIKTSTLYDRGTAPAYISGVNITADNQDDPTYGTVDSTFNFVDFEDSDGDGIHDGATGEPLSMEVKYGSNQFKATCSTPVSLSIFEALDDHFPTKLLPSGTLEEKAIAYSAQLLIDYPLYAKYTGETTQEIKLAGQNNVDLLLSPVNGRVNVIFETEIAANTGAPYYLTVDLLNEQGTRIDGRSLPHTSVTTASAIIFNYGQEVYTGLTVDVDIWGIPNAPGNQTNVIEFPIEAGKNITHVVKYVGAGTTQAGSVSDRIVPVYEAD